MGGRKRREPFESFIALSRPNIPLIMQNPLPTPITQRVLAFSTSEGDFVKFVQQRPQVHEVAGTSQNPKLQCLLHRVPSSCRGVREEWKLPVRKHLVSAVSSVDSRRFNPKGLS